MANSKTKAAAALDAFASLEKEFVRGWLERDPLLGTDLGMHELDPKLPVPGIEGVQDRIRFLKQFRRKFSKVRPERLPPGRRGDLLAARDFIERKLFELEELRLFERIPEAPWMVGHSIYQILGRSYASLQERLWAILSRLEKLPKFVRASVSKLRQPVRLFVENELESVTRLAGFFYKLREIGREHLRRGDVRRFLRAVERTQDSVEDLCNRLIIDVLPDAAEDWSIGEGLYRRALRSAGIDRSPEAVLQHAEKRFNEERRRLREFARRIRRRTVPEDIREMIKERHPATFEDVLDFARDTMKRARAFVVEAKFCTGVPKEDLFIVETPAYLRNTCALWTVWPPGRFEEPPNGYLFLTPPDCDSNRLKEHCYANLSNMIVRLAYPGRHLQQVMAGRQESPLRALSDHPLNRLGWPAYAEAQMKAMGFDDSPEIMFMQINNRMIDAVRASLDVRFWTGRLSPKEAVSHLAVHGGLDWVCAEGDVRRIQAAPVEAVCALFGREAFEHLRSRARAALGRRFSDDFFHDAVLSAGVVALPIVEQVMAAEVGKRRAETPRRPVKSGGGRGKEARRGARPGGRRAGQKKRERRRK